MHAALMLCAALTVRGWSCACGLVTRLLKMRTADTVSHSDSDTQPPSWACLALSIEAGNKQMVAMRPSPVHYDAHVECASSTHQQIYVLYHDGAAHQRQRKCLAY